VAGPAERLMLAQREHPSIALDQARGFFARELKRS
jgi:hypothetical protein